MDSHRLPPAPDPGSSGPVPVRRLCAAVSARWGWPALVVLSFLAAMVAGVGAAATGDAEPASLAAGMRPAPEPFHLLIVAAAALFLAVYWLDRFNVPERRRPAGSAKDERFHLPATNRSTTTAWRYYSAATVYCLIGVSFYSFLVFSPEAWRLVSEVVLASGAGTVPSWLTGASNPFLVALALTVLVPKLPWLRDPDAWLRSKLRYYAAIPDEVRRLSKQLRASDDPAVETHIFTTSYEARRAVRSGLRAELAREMRMGIDLDEWIVFEPATGPSDLSCRWTKAEVLMRHIGAWETEEAFRWFTALHADRLDGLHARRNVLLKRMRELMHVSREITSSEGTHALAAYREDVAEDLRQFLHDLYDFISAAVLSRNRTKGGTSDALAQLGFHVEWCPLRLTVHELALAGMLGFGVMIVGFLLATVPSGSMTIQHALAISLLVSFASAGAVFSAILPRDKMWAIARRRPANRPAWGYYVASGALAMVLQIPCALAFRLARADGVLRVALDKFVERDVSGWLWMSFVLAAGLAALIDRDEPIGRAWLGPRAWLLGGVLLGTAAGFSGVLIALVLGPEKAPLGPVVAMLTALGVVLGLVVPATYRTAPRTRTDALVEHAAGRGITSAQAVPATVEASRAVAS